MSGSLCSMNFRAFLHGGPVRPDRLLTTELAEAGRDHRFGKAGCGGDQRYPPLPITAASAANHQATEVPFQEG